MKISSSFLKVILTALLLLALAAVVAWPDDDDVFLDHAPLQHGQSVMPLDELLGKLKQTLSGEIIAVEREFEHGRLVYEVKIIDERGYVREYYIDPYTAAIIAEDD